VSRKIQLQAFFNFNADTDRRKVARLSGRFYLSAEVLTKVENFKMGRSV